ncbi:MAG TPA: calcium-binding protein [Solirubrobacterales bacterium]|nr:calcium-binding protein [Solirubrobacterales bacterium]
MLLLLGALAIVPSAEAAIVAVESGPPAGRGVGSEQLAYRAAAGENNAVAIAIAGEAEGVVQLTVVDTGAPLAPGAGCSGGGAIGAPVRCAIHRSNPLPHGIFSEADPFRGTYWRSRMSVELGDGENSFDASAITFSPGTYAGDGDFGIPMTVVGGPDHDRILTGGANDAIDPGAGSDEVHGGGGGDVIDAGPSPDGPDLYDLGRDGGDVLYSQRSAPVGLEQGIAGAAGEHDTILDAGDSPLGVGGVAVLGGAAADHLISGGAVTVIGGGPGNDVIGSRSALAFFGGDAGDDRIAGGPGDDFLAGGPGDDTIAGHGGDDDVEGNRGSDLASGGKGDDEISGGPGKDVLRGGPGRDRLLGGSGIDRLVPGARLQTSG